MKKTAFVLAVATQLLVASTALSPSGYALAESPAKSSGDAALREEKLKSIFRREPRAQEFLPKVEDNIAKLKSQPATALYGRRLEGELQQIIMYGVAETESRLKGDVEFLQAAAQPLKPPTQEDLQPLKDRYSKLVAQLDDNVLAKDCDRILKRHDKLIRYSSAGLLSPDKIAEELGKMEEMLNNAQDIAFGKSESLRGLQDRRLASVPKLVYVGDHGHEQEYLSTGRRGTCVLEESTGSFIPLDSADLVIQAPDGSLVNLTTPNTVGGAVPFSPPLSLWMKSRMLEGRVPVINFRMAPAVSKGEPLGVQDVLDGKLDEYFKQNVQEVAATKEAAVLGLFTDFDTQLAQNAFGKDGRTAFYMLDPKLATMDKKAAEAEYVKRAEKGTYTNQKNFDPELCNQYGHPNIPDGPERVRDAWKHVHSMVSPLAPNLDYCSSASAFHGSKAAVHFAPFAGNQSWNKLEYYWPGKGVLDWLGIEAVGTTPSVDPKGANMSEAVDSFFAELHDNEWQETPVLLRACAPGATADPNVEPAWITHVFQQLIPQLHPEVTMVFIDAPSRVTLWSREGAGAYRTNVGSNAFYKWPLRFKMLGAEKAE